MTASVAPPSTPSRNSSSRSRDSGVVWGAGKILPAAWYSMVPASTVLRPQMTQHRFQQKCRRGLAVGSSYATEFELRFGMGEEICGDGSECAPAMCHFDDSDGRIRGAAANPPANQ